MLTGNSRNVNTPPKKKSEKKFRPQTPVQQLWSTPL